MTQTVYLHVGHGKTGSSFLQSALALGRDRLDKAGVCYPLDPKVAARATRGFVTGGNLQPRRALTDNLARFPQAKDHNRLVLSNETLWLLLSHPKQTWPAQIREAFPDARIKVLCFTRDPLDHAVSAYQQAVKRNGYVGDCASYLANYEVPRRLPRLARALDEIGAELTLRSYSRNRSTLLTELETWLELPPDTLPSPKRAQINRSLTRAEMALQQAFNTHLGGYSSIFVSDPLCDHLPEIQSEWPVLTPTDLAAFLDRMQRMIADPEVADLLPVGQGYHLPSLDEAKALFPATQTALEFTPEQINVLAKAVSTILLKASPDLADALSKGLLKGAQAPSQDPPSGPDRKASRRSSERRE